MSSAGRIFFVGGDAFLSICLWRLGFAPTDPGPWFNELRMRLFDGASWMDTHSLASHFFEAAEGVCTDPICQVNAGAQLYQPAFSFRACCLAYCFDLKTLPLYL